jgi:hypothetical protein
LHSGEASKRHTALVVPNLRSAIVSSIWTVSDRAMLSKWNAILRSLFAPPQGTALRAVRDIGRFGIGFCPGCKRLRGAPSPRCEHCGSTRPVVPDP